MTTEYITRVKLEASEGMMLTDGKEYAKIVFLAVGEDSLKYYEVSESEYEKVLAEQKKVNELLRP